MQISHHIQELPNIISQYFGKRMICQVKFLWAGSFNIPRKFMKAIILRIRYRQWYVQFCLFAWTKHHSTRKNVSLWWLTFHDNLFIHVSLLFYVDIPYPLPLIHNHYKQKCVHTNITFAFYQEKKTCAFYRLESYRFTQQSNINQESAQRMSLRTHNVPVHGWQEIEIQLK